MRERVRVNHSRAAVCSATHKPTPTSAHNVCVCEHGAEKRGVRGGAGEEGSVRWRWRREGSVRWRKRAVALEKGGKRRVALRAGGIGRVLRLHLARRG